MQTTTRTLFPGPGIPRILLALEALTLLTACRSETLPPPPAQINVSNQVIQQSVKRFGMNLGQSNPYDSGQMMKNLVFSNAGFEGDLFRSIVACVEGSPALCADHDRFTAWPSGFWNQASFEVIAGPGTGDKGVIDRSESSSPKGSEGTAFHFHALNHALGAGSHLVLMKKMPSDPSAGWWFAKSSKASLQSEFKDLSPDTPGKRALRLSAPTPSEWITLSSYFDNTNGRSFLRVNGAYRLSFRAKAALGAPHFAVRVVRIGFPPFIARDIALANSWRNVSVDFRAAEPDTAVGAMQLAFEVQGGDVLLDDVSLARLDGDPANHTVFQDGVVNALKELRPGTLRYWADQLGETLDNLLAGDFARQRSGYSAWKTGADAVQYGLPSFLELCATTGAEPWFVAPTTFSEQEAQDLVEYLAGPQTTHYGAVRAALGKPLPWTSTFDKIHIEFGNEAWNPTFRGGSIEDPRTYGMRSAAVFRAMRRSPYFDAARFDLILGGQTVYIDRNRTILSNADAFNTFAIESYLSGRVDQFGSDEDLFGPLFAEPQSKVKAGPLKQNAELLRALAPKANLAVYEMNLGTVDGGIDQATLAAYTPSAGAALAVAEQLLLNLGTLGIQQQDFFQLAQFAYRRGDGKEARLWGSVVDMAKTGRRRPQFLAIQMLNRAISGDMVQTEVIGGPHWNQPETNGVKMHGAAYLECFGFADAHHHALAVLNLHRTLDLAATFTGTNPPKGAVAIQQLRSAHIRDTNEDAETVRIHTDQQKDFRPDVPYRFPAHSLTILEWDDRR